MLFSKEADNQKIITMYIICTCTYLPVLLMILHFSGFIYFIGKSSFLSVLLLIVVIETAKYFIGTTHFKKNDVNLMKKYEEVTAFIRLKNFFSKSKLREGCKIFLCVCVMTTIYFLFSICYGAEIFSKHEETFMFSALLSVLTVFPTCINLGSLSFVCAVSGCKPSDKLESLIYQNIYLTLIGAWLGAFVIPLDWDRPWQQWPIPCSFGAMVGFLFSHIVMYFQMKCQSLKKEVHH